MLSVEALECRYGKVAAVRGLSLEVKQGELVSLIGANGAGKTTTLKAISGVLRAAGGRIAFEGEDITHATARRILALGIAHCPEGRHVFPYMTVRENLEMGSYLRHDKAAIEADMARLFERFLKCALALTEPEGMQERDTALEARLRRRQAGVRERNLAELLGSAAALLSPRCGAKGNESAEENRAASEHKKPPWGMSLPLCAAPAPL